MNPIENLKFLIWRQTRSSKSQYDFIKNPTSWNKRSQSHYETISSNKLWSISFPSYWTQKNEFHLYILFCSLYFVFKENLDDCIATRKLQKWSERFATWRLHKLKYLKLNQMWDCKIKELELNLILILKSQKLDLIMNYDQIRIWNSEFKSN